MMRAYLDHNATSPLRAEARQAMISAMDVVGNPSSVHAEGRAAKGIVEKARSDLAEALGAQQADIVFTSGATESSALVHGGNDLSSSALEHDAVLAWTKSDLGLDGAAVRVPDPQSASLQLANSETGILQTLPKGLAVSDITQAFGRVPFSYNWSGVTCVFLSAHKFGGPKGVGALIVPQGFDLPAQVKGGGQEMGRRSGTENVIAIAGMAAAATAIQADLASGLWSRIEQLRNILETAIEAETNDTIFVGKDASRLPNTSCFIAPGWKGETQVMAMDLEGFAVSAGSACSSGKVRGSRVLQALGYDDEMARCALRVSLGPENTEEEVLAFAESWCRKRNSRRAA